MLDSLVPILPELGPWLSTIVLLFYGMRWVISREDRRIADDLSRKNRDLLEARRHIAVLEEAWLAHRAECPLFPWSGEDNQSSEVSE